MKEITMELILTGDTDLETFKKSFIAWATQQGYTFAGQMAMFHGDKTVGFYFSFPEEGRQLSPRMKVMLDQYKEEYGDFAHLEEFKFLRRGEMGEN